MKAIPLYALLAAGAMLLAGLFLAMAFRETDRGLDAVVVSAVVAYVIQVGAFALALRFAQRGQAIAGWGLLFLFKQDSPIKSWRTAWVLVAILLSCLLTPFDNPFDNVHTR